MSTSDKLLLSQARQQQMFQKISPNAKEKISKKF